MRAFTLRMMSNPVAKRIAVGFGIVILVMAMLLVPASAEVVQASGWCSQTASFAGRKGWQKDGPNYVAEFSLDAGRHEYYIYYLDSYVNYRVVAPQSFDGTTTQFGVSTWLAARHYGWGNASRWRIDYNC